MSDPNDIIEVVIKVNGDVVDTVTARPAPGTPAEKAAFVDLVKEHVRNALG